MAKSTDTRVLYLSEIGSLLPADCLREGAGRKLRSTPLPWLKFRTPADTTPTGQRYTLRRQAIKAHDQGMAMLGIYDEMLSIYGGDRTAALRGYLVNYNLRAASTAEIAQAIGCWDRDLVSQAIAHLLSVGLLAYKDTPDFAAAIHADRTIAPHDDPPADPYDGDEPDDILRADDAPQRATRQRTRASQQGKTRRKVPQNMGLQPCEDGQSCQAVAGQKGGDTRHKTRDVKPSDERPPSADSAAPLPPSADGCGNTAAPETASALAAPPPKPDVPTADAGRQTRDRTPDTAPPCPAGPADGTRNDDPTGNEPQADALTGDLPTGDTPPESNPHPCVPSTGHALSGDEPTADEPTEADPKAAGQGPAQAQGVDMTWHAESYAQQIMDVLYPTRDEVVQQSRKCQGGAQPPDEFAARELGCLRHAFETALVGMGQIDAMRLLPRSIAEAQRCHKIKSPHPRGRYWRWWFGQHMAALRRDRAGASGPP